MDGPEADRESALVDLLTNLMHLADPEVVEEALQTAQVHYDVESQCPGCRGLIGDVEELCDTCQVDPACIRGGGA